MISLNNFNTFCLMTGYKTSGLNYEEDEIHGNEIDILSYVNDVFDEFEANLITLEKNQYNKLLFYYLKRIDENLQFYEVLKEEDIFRTTYNVNNIISKKDYEDYKSKFSVYANTANMANRKLLSMIKNHISIFEIEVKFKKWEFESTLYNKEFESEKYSNTNIKNKRVRSYDIDWNSSNETQSEEIKEIFNELVKRKFIDESSNFETFDSIFNPNNNNQLTKINWLKDLKSLIFLFKQLKQRGVISFSSLDYSVIKHKFKIKNIDITIQNKTWIQYYSDTKILKSDKLQTEIERIVNQFS